ncbi:probable Rad51-associated protein Brh2 [Ustilago sp. UG-2017b]|nr:probable Rad51-associated protein Brh2 [Ustilago sp. UG-2017b]
MHDNTSSAVQALPPASLDQLQDDELAATQQSILEELHTISEQAIMHNPHRDSLSTEGIAKQAAHAIQTNEQLVAVEPSTSEVDKVQETVTSASIPLVPESEQLQEAFVDNAQQLLIQAIATEAALAVTQLPATMDGQLDAHLDHTNLFDGIDAGAFSDIELSPPVRRQAFLPSIDAPVSTIHAQSPASPTRNGNLQASQPLNALELTRAGEDAPPEELPEPSQMASFLDPQFVGFKTGHGKHAKPSGKSLQAARKLFLDLQELQDPLLPPPPAASQALSPQLRPPTLDSPSKQSLMAPKRGFTRPTMDRTPLQEAVPKQISVMPNASQAGQSPTPKGKLASSQVISAAQAMSTSQVERQPFATPKPIRNGLFSSAASLASPVRTAAAAAASASRFTTPQPSKRINLMPRVDIGGSTGRKRTLPKFVTPFKNGKRPKTDEQEELASPLRRPNNGLTHDLHPPSPIANRHYPPPQRQVKAGPSSEGPAVFNLHSNTPRQKLADVGRPEQVSALQMIAKGAPDEVLVILNDASRASQYAFEAANGDLLMQQDAYDELHARACNIATLPWVSNHWTLILWKLAAIVRLDPGSASERWSWDELIRQLLYRYEREINRAQRSCLKRIQEYDSSPARPMVLFVSKIMEEENEIQDRSGQVVVRKSTLLELSDGWYRIQAQLDPVLGSACRRGRVRIGQKLATMGATLDAQGEGNEVLTAYHMSSLVLSSNSVSLARWDAKLGFTSTRFFASLRSLTPEGGLVSLMDVVITKVFPLAYVDTERNGGPSAPRGEQEEAEEQEVWLKRREDAMQQLEMELESENSKLFDLVEALSDLASDSFLPSIPDDPIGRLEASAQQLFDQLRAKEDPASAVKELVIAKGHSNLAPWLYGMAKSALLAEDMSGVGARLGADLDRACPPRKVREFRVVRFRDARLPPPSPPTAAAASASASAGAGGAKKRNPHARTVQLTVWDAAQLGEELQEGRRFWVTNLTPSSKSAWRKPDEAADVFLSTRRDTKWRPVL